MSQDETCLVRSNLRGSLIPGLFVTNLLDKEIRLSLEKSKMCKSEEILCCYKFVNLQVTKYRCQGGQNLAFA